MMIEINKEKVIKDLQLFKEKGYHDRMKKIYRKLPITQCNGCGTCCNDSPVVSYAEFLYAYDFYTSFSKDKKIEILKNAIKENMYGLTNKFYKCCFLDSDNHCMVYDRAPLACKRWGIQSEEENAEDFSIDLDRNLKYKEFYDKKGIVILDEILNLKLPYCRNVKIVKNPYKVSSYDFKENFLKEVEKISLDFWGTYRDGWALGTYLIYSHIGSDIFKDRIKVIRDYQNGNLQAVDEYLAKVDFESLLS